eukprot:386-Rhodomonas_salina.1
MALAKWVAWGLTSNEKAVLRRRYMVEGRRPLNRRDGYTVMSDGSGGGGKPSDEKRRDCLQRSSVLSCCIHEQREALLEASKCRNDLTGLRVLVPWHSSGGRKPTHYDPRCCEHNHARKKEFALLRPRERAEVQMKFDMPRLQLDEWD